MPIPCILLLPFDQKLHILPATLLSIIVNSNFAKLVIQLDHFLTALRLFQIFTVARIESIDTLPLLISIGLGFALSLLFVMDQNISAAMVETAVHKLKKGSQLPHVRLAIIGCSLSITIA